MGARADESRSWPERSPATASLQARFAPDSRCFGCGPANVGGLRLETRLDPTGSGWLVADWQARPEHEAFDGYVNGGILSTLLDCALNWAGTWALAQRNAARPPREVVAVPDCVTAELSVRFRRPTSSRARLIIRSRATAIDGDRVAAEGSIEADGVLTVVATGRFVAVGEDHPASGRWTEGGRAARRP